LRKLHFAAATITEIEIWFLQYIPTPTHHTIKWVLLIDQFSIDDFRIDLAGVASVIVFASPSDVSTTTSLTFGNHDNKNLLSFGP